MFGMVVVSRADMPRIGARCSSSAAMNSFSEVSTPRSITSKPAPESIMMQRFFPMSCRSPFTVPMITVPAGSTPEAERIGSIWAIPAFMARAQASTSGTKMKFSRNLIPTMPIPAISASSMISRASVPSSSACAVSASTVSLSPSISAAAMSCIGGRIRAESATFRSISSGRSRNSSISARMRALAMSDGSAMSYSTVKAGDPMADQCGRPCSSCQSRAASVAGPRVSDRAGGNKGPRR